MFLPEADRDYLIEKGYEFEEAIDNNRKGLVIKNWVLPENKFNVTQSHLLILLPDSYPDIPPDMFYFHPSVLLMPTNRHARATDAMEAFRGIQWQRWSRHLGAEVWRRGVDGIHTYLKRVDEALKVAS